MLKNIKAERRLSPRIVQNLAVSLSANGYMFATSTQNISCTGAYCHIDKYMPPFTKLAIKMVLPVVSEHKIEQYDIECKGVIVRANDEDRGGFNIAIYFNEINKSQQQKISRYIKQFLPS